MPSDSICKTAKKSEVEIKWVGSKHLIFWQSPNSALQGVTSPVLHCAVAQIITDWLLRAKPQLALLICTVRTFPCDPWGKWQVIGVGEVMGV